MRSVHSSSEAGVAAARRETKGGRALNCRGAAGLQHEWRPNCSIMRKHCSVKLIHPSLPVISAVRPAPPAFKPVSWLLLTDGWMPTFHPPEGQVCPSESPSLRRVPCVYLGGRPSRALFRHSGVLSVSAVDRGTSGVSALESTSPSPSASPGRSGLSSPPASCQNKHAVTQTLLLTAEVLPTSRVDVVAKGENKTSSRFITVSARRKQKLNRCSLTGLT